MRDSSGVLRSGDASTVVRVQLNGFDLAGRVDPDDGWHINQSTQFDRYLANRGGEATRGQFAMNMRLFNDSAVDYSGILDTSLYTGLSYGRVIEVPEPASGILVLGGLAALAALRRYRLTAT